MKINLNDEAEVRLTPKGVLLALLDEQQNKDSELRFPPGFDPNGCKLKTQVWNLARMFGQNFCVGSTNGPIVDNEIEVTRNLGPMNAEDANKFDAALKLCAAARKLVRILRTYIVQRLDTRDVPAMHAEFIAAIEDVEELLK